MKNSLGKHAAFAAAVALAAACGSGWAQTIPVPASSADSGRRAVVAVTQPNMSNYATKTEVNNAYNYAASAYNYAGQAQQTANNASSSLGRSWTIHFLGQARCDRGLCATIRGDGSVVVGEIYMPTPANYTPAYTPFPNRYEICGSAYPLTSDYNKMVGAPPYDWAWSYQAGCRPAQEPNS